MNISFAAITAGGEAALEAQLIEATKELNKAFPNRFQNLIADGEEHTFVLKSFDYEIGGTTVRQWISDMLNSSEDWDPVSD
ncbi:MAG: hypothetical protein AAFO82_16220 [Bacteroidota bacterium]